MENLHLIVDTPNLGDVEGHCLKDAIRDTAKGVKKNRLGNHMGALLSARTVTTNANRANPILSFLSEPVKQ